eukprot:5535213-Amphidinium_carterae.1
MWRRAWQLWESSQLAGHQVNPQHWQFRHAGADKWRLVFGFLPALNRSIGPRDTFHTAASVCRRAGVWQPALAAVNEWMQQGYQKYLRDAHTEVFEALAEAEHPLAAATNLSGYLRSQGARTGDLFDLQGESLDEVGDVACQVLADILETPIQKVGFLVTAQAADVLNETVFNKYGVACEIDQGSPFLATYNMGKMRAKAKAM